MAEELKALMDEALGVDGAIVGTGLPTKMVEKMAEIDPDTFLEFMPTMLEKIGPIMEKIEGEVAGVEVNDLLEFVEKMDMGELMGKMQEADPAKIEELMPGVMPKMAEYMPKIMPAMMALMDKVTASDEELAEELEGAEDMAINIQMGDAMAMTMQIKDGKMAMGTTPVDNADMSIEIPMDIMVGMITGTADPMSAFMGGDVKMDGDMSKGMALMPLMTVFSEKFGMELM